VATATYGTASSAEDRQDDSDNDEDCAKGREEGDWHNESNDEKDDA